MPPISSSTRPSAAKAVLVIIGLLLVIMFITHDQNGKPIAMSSPGSVNGVTEMAVTSDASAPLGSFAARSAVAPSFAPMDKMIAPIPPMTGGASAEDRQRVGAKIVRNGSVNIRVLKTEETLNQIKSLAESKGGFVADSNVSAYNDTKTGSITVRIPSNKFDETVQAIKALGTATLQESTQAEDVTDQYVDVDARLRSAQAEEQQYLTILHNAKTIEDTLNVTNRLADVRSRIEQLQGQIRLLSDRTDFATLNVTLTESASLSPSPTNAWSPSETFRQAFRDLVHSLQGLLSSLITAAVFLVGLLLPFAILVAILAWVANRVWKRFVK